MRKQWHSTITWVYYNVIMYMQDARGECRRDLSRDKPITQVFFHVMTL